METQQEYERIRALFADADESQAALVDGAMWEAARLRCELDRLHQIVRMSGLVRVDPANPLRQKELPVSRMITKIRANYLSYIDKLAKIMGRSVDIEELDMDEYE